MSGSGTRIQGYILNYIFGGRFGMCEFNSWDGLCMSVLYSRTSVLSDSTSTSSFCFIFIFSFPLVNELDKEKRPSSGIHHFNE